VEARKERGLVSKQLPDTRQDFYQKNKTKIQRIRNAEKGGRDRLPVLAPRPLCVDVLRLRHRQHALIETLVLAKVEGVKQAFKCGSLA
jgi:hypothetical protein